MNRFYVCLQMHKNIDIWIHSTMSSELFYEAQRGKTMTVVIRTVIAKTHPTKGQKSSFGKCILCKL